MPEFQYFLGARASKHIDNVAGAKKLAGPLDARKKHLGGYGQIDRIRCLSLAIVAHSAIFRGIVLTEIIQKRDATAEVGFSKTNERIQEDIGNPLIMLCFLINKVLDFADIPVAEKEKTMGRQTVPPGAPDFLVVVVDASGQVIMDDKTDVGLVDSHAEGDCRHDDLDVIPDKEFLILRSLPIREARMVGSDGITLPVQDCMEVIRLLAGKTVNDS